MVTDFGCRVEGLSFSVQGLAFRVWDLGFKGLWFRVEG
jgi:hypothetical protein